MFESPVVSSKLLLDKRNRLVLSIGNLFKNYIKANTDGRALINMVAEREAFYSQDNSKK
jgi:hypothetical protein